LHVDVQLIARLVGSGGNGALSGLDGVIGAEVAETDAGDPSGSDRMLSKL
jgi:hypothetical protein